MAAISTNTIIEGTVAPSTDLNLTDGSSAFSAFQESDVIISSDLVSTPVWTGDRGILPGPASTSSQMTTSSAQKLGLSGNYYLDVYNVTSSNISSSNVQFSLAYADIEGSGSVNYNSGVNGYSPTRTNYGQYKALILGGESDTFVFNSSPSEYFYVISIDRARYKEKLMPGSFKLILSGTLGDVTLVDDKFISLSTSNIVGSNRYYNIIAQSSGSDDQPVSYGWFLPDIGTILLDGAMLESASILTADRQPATTQGLDPLTNASNLYSVIKEFTLRSEETVTSNYLFVRARNGEFNYSTNPTFSDATGNVPLDMIYFPETYITTVGLYNDQHTLMAVAKLSKPLPKNFTKEALIRVKLDF
jgi:hypothetical protein